MAGLSTTRSIMLPNAGESSIAPTCRSIISSTARCCRSRASASPCAVVATASPPPPPSSACCWAPSSRLLPPLAPPPVAMPTAIFITIFLTAGLPSIARIISGSDGGGGGGVARPTTPRVNMALPGFARMRSGKRSSLRSASPSTDTTTSPMRRTLSLAARPLSAAITLLTVTTPKPPSPRSITTRRSLVDAAMTAAASIIYFALSVTGPFTAAPVHVYLGT
eukprot:640111-Prymnesium_polylepis.1